MNKPAGVVGCVYVYYDYDAVSPAISRLTAAAQIIIILFWPCFVSFSTALFTFTIMNLADALM